MTRAQALPVIPPDRGDDLHHLDCLDHADLILFMAGNQFMVMEELLGAFAEVHAPARTVFYETLPPGLELKQILAGGAVFGDRVIPGRADCYASVSEEAMKRLEEASLVRPGTYRPYLHNRIVIMVPAGNPLGIRSVADLGRGDVVVSQPDPENEDIGRHILAMYEAAGGPALVRRIMEEKRAAGTTLFTRVHHRETPQRILEGRVHAGPVWATEAAHARRRGLAVEAVEPGPELDQRDRVTYYVCPLAGAPHPAAARAFVEFLGSPRAQEIYAWYGFVPHLPATRRDRAEP